MLINIFRIKNWKEKLKIEFLRNEKFIHRRKNEFKCNLNFPRNISGTNEIKKRN